MGIGVASGENRTAEATKKAISSPLLEVSIDGAEQILLNITGGSDLTLFEAQDASDIVAQASTSEVNIIFGTSINEELGDEVIVTVIATGIDNDRKKEEKKAANRGGSPFRGRKEVAPQQAPQVEREERQAAPEKEVEPEKDLFGDWDIRRESSVRDTNVQPTNENYPRYQQTTEEESGDDELETPPFFRKRRR